jgi:uncharacterized protein (TIGR03067 family)
MMCRALLTVAALLLPAGAPTQNDTTAKKAEPLQGEWKLVCTQDARQTDSGCDESRMIVQADGGVVFQLADRTVNRGALQFGACGKLKSLDLKLVGGQTLLGVYEEKGDDLVICFAEAGQERPAGVTPQGAQWAEKWKRAKP